jgi:antitoxin (DNA-binding transcriptional repressor) of toxin-antitoxin stability system
MVLRWLKDGQQVQITSRGVPLGHLKPLAQPKRKKKNK